MSKRIKFTGMDAFIIIAILAVIVAAVVILGGGDTGAVASKGKSVEAELCVELTGKEKAYSELMKVGDKVLLGEKDKKEARVTKVEVTPAETLSFDIMEGEVIMGKVPEHYDIKIYMEGEATETEKDIKLGNAVEIKVGQGIALSSKEWTGYGYILELDVTE